MDPLPPFYRARSMLSLEEARKTKQAETNATSPTALVVNGNPTNPPPLSNSTSQSHVSGSSNRGSYREAVDLVVGVGLTIEGVDLIVVDADNGNLVGCQIGNNNRGNGIRRLTPRPTTTVRAPINPGAGILGARPQQAYHVSAPSSYAPTEIDAAFNTMTLQPPDDQWYMDSGATSHIASNTGKFSNVFNYRNAHHNIVGDGTPVPVTAYVPNIVKNLISVRQFTKDNNVSIDFDPLGFSVKDLQTGNRIMRCNSSGDLYPIPSSFKSSRSTPSTFVVVKPSIWHARLGHPGPTILQSLRSSNLISSSSDSFSCVCSSCELGKQNKLPFFKSLSNSVAPFDIIHSDIWTSPIVSTSGHKYYLLFLDDYTNFVWTFPMANNNQTFSIFCDNGREYNNTRFLNLCNDNGIHIRFSCPYTSSQNGKAERKLRTINNMCRTLLLHAHLPLSFWHFGIHMASYLHNILPSKVITFSCPTSLLYSKIPSYSHLRVFGCLCFPHTSRPQHKLLPRSTPCVFLGYPSNHRGYLCYDLSRKRFIISRHVTFDEHEFPYLTYKSSSTTSTHTQDIPSFTSPPPSHLASHSSSNQPTSPLSHPSSTTQESVLPASNPTSNSPPRVSNPHPTSSPLGDNTCSHPSQPTVNKHIPTSSSSHPMITLSQHGILKPNPKYACITTSPSISPLPTSHVDALRDPNWHKAMIDEYDALIKNDTWELVPRPLDVNVIRSMWIFTHKFQSNGALERHKARLVCNGRSQQVGIDCMETFSPVVKPATIRMVLSIAVSKKWEIHQLDVKNAFLHGTLQETVYIHQPPGFRDESFPNHVCRLKWSLYGLKQAPRAWYHRFANFVTSIGFSQSKSDNSLFVYQKGTDIAYLLLYVDDFSLQHPQILYDEIS
ncbi:LOW QUALITY PROTEIN: hypothetical protein OSB04_005662 [Centaurea solstitialis]|uniref:Integrase catalytic domain-containing protein n=1 Tax=Centaurea solstitialis TaxID=347529 RepID=A0AA38TZM0_9ASTR|nr:LOW QUALITY PROTEIN: hypothetical protein OSB04_005662 [Centaurea solstitialis]